MEGNDDIRMQREAISDGRIVKILPYLVVACLLAGVLNVVYDAPYDSIGSVFVGFSEAFVVGFVLLGIYAFFFAGERRVDKKVPIFLYAVGPIAVAMTSYILGLTIIPEAFDSTLFTNTGDPFNDVLLISLKLYLIMFVVLFAGYGVLSVVSSYFRQYIGRVYKYIGRLKNDGTDDRKGKAVLKLYGVPDIIDIHDVEMEPIHRENDFPMSDFISMALSIFALGVVICSYIFLNPVFIGIMTIYETIMIGILISFFIPVLIVPWFITKETGTKIKSQARDLYLWKGMKNRLYQSFFTITVILLLVILSLYMGSDFNRIIYTYVGYIAFMAFMSIIYSFTYFNRYNIELKEGILKRFNEDVHEDVQEGIQEYVQ